MGKRDVNRMNFSILGDWTAQPRSHVTKITQMLVPSLIVVKFFGLAKSDQLLTGSHAAFFPSM